MNLTGCQETLNIVVGVFEISFKIPPSNPLRPIEIPPFEFVYSIALIILGEFPDADMATTTSFGNKCAFNCCEKISMHLVFT